MLSRSMVRALLVAALAGGAPSSLLAQDSWSLPVDRARVIQLGETRTGELDRGDRRLEDDSYYENWYFEGRAGQRITVTLRSGDFDAYLAVGRHMGSSLDTDDDSGGDTDAQITLTLSSAGTYVFRVNSLSEGETGSYRLSVSDGSGSSGGGSGANGGTSTGTLLLRPADNTRRVSVGGSVSGSLDGGDGRLEDNSHYELWYLDLRAGQRVAITMRASAFDAYLHVGRQGSETVATTDDDGAGGTDAEATLTATTGGTYVIIANSLSAGSTGSYTISVRELAGMSDAGEPMPISVNRTVSGELSASDPRILDGSHYDAYVIEGRAGERVAITMRSGDFDAYLSLREMDGTQIESNDDGEAFEGSTDAQIIFTFPRTGRYKIYANSLTENQTGRYTLTVERR